jgi:hypothetical protein
MVLLHVKQKDDRQFLFEAPTRDCVDTVIRDLVLINNLQLRILGMKEESKRLALYGPSKHPDDDEDSDDEASKKIEKIRGPHYNKDPHCRRTGEGEIMSIIYFSRNLVPIGNLPIMGPLLFYSLANIIYTTNQLDESEECELMSS